MAPSPRELSRRHAAVTEGVNSTSSRRGASRCVRQSLPRARGRWREAPDEVPGPVVGAGVPDGPFARLRDISRPAAYGYRAAVDIKTAGSDLLPAVKMNITLFQRFYLFYFSALVLS